MSKRYKQETTALLSGVLRYLSGNNAPMMAAFRRLREKKILCMCEKVALETGFYTTFRAILATTALIKDPAVRANKIYANVFEYSRTLFMAVMEMITRVIPATPVVQALEATEVYRESDFVCPYSMKQIEHPVEIRLDDGTHKVRKRRYAGRFANKRRLKILLRLEKKWLEPRTLQS